MSGITLESSPAEERLAELNVRQWPIWTCEPSEFPWSYDERETCYILEGMDCTWKVLKAVKKHYTFG